MASVAGTQLYLSPEAFSVMEEQKGLGKESSEQYWCSYKSTADVWSFGVLAYNIANLELLFDN
jgi:serine/threonine protein kinase